LSLSLVPHLGVTRFAIHVEPVLFLIVPVYRFVTDDPCFLLWLQAVVMALGGLPLYGLARRRLANDWAALAMVAVYYLLPIVESVTLFDFHAVGLAPTLLLAALYFLDRALITPDDPRGLWTGPVKSQIPNPKSQVSNGVWSGLFFLLALGTKEDIALHVFMVGLYLLALRRRWRPGLALSLVGLVWAYLAFFVVIPASRPGGSHSAYFDFFAALGDTPLEIILAPIRAPGKVWALLVTPDNVHALGMLTLALAFTPLVGWPFFIMAAPTLAIVLLSSNPLMRQLETYHYAAPAVPFVMLAAVDGITRLSNIKCQIPNPKSQIPNLKFVIPLLVLAVSLVYHVYRGYSPLALSFHWPEVTAHERLGDELAASIPPTVPVVAQAELVPLADHRPWIQIWQGPFDPRADYFFFDVSHPAFVNRDGAQENLLSDIARDPTVGLVASNDGYLLLRRGAPRLPTSPEFFTFVFARPPASATPVAATFGDSLELVAFETHRNYADREAEPSVTLYWRALPAPAGEASWAAGQDGQVAPPPEDYFIAIFLLDETGQPAGVTRYQQPLTVWWPASRWEPGQTVRLLANTFPWWTGDRRRFGYGVALVRGHEPWDAATRLPVIRADGGPIPLDGGTLLPLVTFRRIAGIPYAQ
jgi:uncharacterized membrane protein